MFSRIRESTKGTQISELDEAYKIVLQAIDAGNMLMDSRRILSNVDTF
jgi:hypothetical protein